MKKQFYLTKEGVDELTLELVELKSQRGPIAERIKTAREFGDLSENAEYSSARQEQERAEARIAEVENILLNVEIIKKPIIGRYLVYDLVELSARQCTQKHCPS